MDRNSIIGFVLLILIAGGYFLWSNHEQKVYYEQKRADSLAKVANQQEVPEAASLPTAEDNSNALAATTDSLHANITTAFQGKNERITLSNGKLSIQFNTKGGAPVEAALDSFRTYESKYITKDDQQLRIFSGDSNRFAYLIPVNGKTIATDELYFTPQIVDLPDGSKQLRMTAQLEEGQTVEMNYTLPADRYMLTANLRLQGFEKDLKNTAVIPLHWTTQALHTEKDLKYERLNTQVHFRYSDEEHDYFTLERTAQKTMEEPIQWLGLRTHFFNSTIIADQSFKSADFNGVIPADSNIVASNTSVLNIPVVASNDFTFGYRWYMGPNDYKLLKSYKIDMEEMIPLGFGIFFFVKYISKWMIIPLFDFLGRFISSFGIIIICITLIIRFLLSFFSYKSYLSSAKMRVLKPELDELRAKYGDNQQQMGMEQMKLYRTAGVNPLGGCLPMLLQMPFLLSMYYFFPTAIQLRQSSFLWAEDLSTFDSILNLGFNIPFYGSHVSLFTLLMTATSLFLAIYNRNMTAGAASNDPNMKMMKYMPYVMPFMFLGWFNSMAAGLTFYYTCSNLVSMAQQFVIQKFFIDEAAIHRKMQENKGKPKTTSKWQQKMEELQKAQAEKMKQQPRRNK